RLTSKFGWRVNPITKKISFHTGIDLAVAEGTPVAAALPGKVCGRGQSAAYGNYIILDNGGGVKTFYGHCQAILAPLGAVLRAGDIIAKSGNTGMTTGPHLHFEIRVRNIYVNPLWLLTPDEK
ncbi:MAG: M23 family metallopeptidase, partial [Clostridia bacterium]|nr:M23 family metallopeptidase [Clostridia bacterium]